MNIQRNTSSKRIVVLDTSAFLVGFDPLSLSIDQVTVPKVKEEIKANSITLVRLKTAVENGRLKVKAPSEEFLKRAKTCAAKVGDSFFLSDTDLQILALALELRESGFSPQIVTDDYSIQNVATKMGIEFAALATYGIRRLLQWVRYCPACHREYDANYRATKCIICGTELKRKPRKTAKSLKNKD